MWKNETKASGKIRRSKSTKTSQKTSEVEDLRSPETKAAKRRVGQQRSPKVYRTTTAINNRFESKSSTEQRTSKGGMTVSKMRPTDKPKAHREAVYRDTLRSRPRSLPRSRPVKSYRQAKSPPGCNLLSRPRSRPAKSTKSTKILLKPPFESATMKSTGWSPKRTSKDDYLVNQHLEVNATYR